MFITRKEFQAYQARMEDNNNRQTARYWELVEAHERLLEHFGLQEDRIKAHTVLRSKGGTLEQKQ